MSNSCEIPQGREYANENVNDNPPSASALKAADAIEVFDEEGKKHTFKSIYKRPDLPKRVLVVFVRHFYCCSCVHYTKWLAENATPEKLKALDTAIIIVGHGDVKQIEMYRQETGWQYPIYTEPSEKIYSTLGMIKTWKDGPPNSYMPHSYAYAAYWSIKLAIWRFMQGYPVISSGAPNLQGGEFMFEGQGEDRVVTWCHRMKHSRDHADTDEISEVLGLKEVVSKLL